MAKKPAQSRVDTSGTTGRARSVSIGTFTNRIKSGKLTRPIEEKVPFEHVVVEPSRRKVVVEIKGAKSPDFVTKRSEHQMVRLARTKVAADTKLGVTPPPRLIELAKTPLRADKKPWTVVDVNALVADKRDGLLPWLFGKIKD